MVGAMDGLHGYMVQLVEKGLLRMPDLGTGFAYIRKADSELREAAGRLNRSSYGSDTLPIERRCQPSCRKHQCTQFLYHQTWTIEHIEVSSTISRIWTC